jgi:hypothetical protein
MSTFFTKVHCVRSADSARVARLVMGSVLAIVLPALLAACDGVVTSPAAEGEAAPSVAKVTASPGRATLDRAGGAVQLGAFATDAQGRTVSGVAVTWTSLHPTVAIVNDSGLVTAVGSGTARVVAAAGEVADTAEVVVTTQGLVLTAVSATVDRSGSVRIGATLVGADGSVIGSTIPRAPRPLEAVWTSSDSTIASVNSEGLVRGLAAGYTVVSARVGQFRAELPVKIVDRRRLVGGTITVTPKNPEVSIGGMVQLSVAVVGSDNLPIVDPSITWLSYDPTVAWVDAEGRVTRLTAGAARIAAVSALVSDTAFFTITPSNRASSTYHVPASIAYDCSADATADLLNWIASVPDNVKLVFRENSCYNIDRGLIIADRHGILFEGNGATFRLFSPGHSGRGNWTFVGGGNITLRNMTASGAHPDAGPHRDAWDKTKAWQHGYRFKGVQGGLLENVQAYDVYGDFVNLEGDVRLRSPGEPTRNVTVRNSRFERNGRMGVSITNAQNVVIENNFIGDVRWSAIDLELNHDLESGRDILILNNRFGRVFHAIFANHGAGSSESVASITFSHNVMEADPLTCIPPISVGAPNRGMFWTGYSIEGNALRSYGRAIHVQRIREMNISGNVFHWVRGECGHTEITRIDNAHAGIVSGNSAVGFRDLWETVRADSLSTGLTITNTTRQLTSRWKFDWHVVLLGFAGRSFGFPTKWWKLELPEKCRKL